MPTVKQQTDMESIQKMFRLQNLKIDALITSYLLIKGVTKDGILLFKMGSIVNYK